MENDDIFGYVWVAMTDLSTKYKIYTYIATKS